MTPPTDRPPLLPGGRRALIATACYPPRPGGSSTVMYNLLSQFAPDSYVVATADNSRVNAHTFRLDGNVQHVVRQPGLPHRLRKRIVTRQRSRLASNLSKLISQECPSVVIGVYPDLDFLQAGLEAAQAEGIPFVAYLHDAPIEVAAHTADAQRAVDLQAKVIEQAAHIFVMSEGMRDLFRGTYGVDTTALEHTFPEFHEPPATTNLVAGIRHQAFWGGQVHSTNSSGCQRFVEACASFGLPFVTTASANVRGFDRHDAGTPIEVADYPTRDAYRRALTEQGALVVAVDWPDESKMQAGELLTVFPTKLVEYLAAGRPIVAHCPPESFLNRFLTETSVGTVVTERSTELLAEALQAAVDTERISDDQKAKARAALDRFAPGRLSDLFASTLSRIANP